MTPKGQLWLLTDASVKPRFGGVFLAAMRAPGILDFWRVRGTMQLKRGVLMCLMMLTGVWASASAFAMSYRLVPFDDGRCGDDCPSMIVASGTITGREAEEFSWFFRQNAANRRLLKLMIIHSPGGNAYGGMALGSLIRSNQVTVVVGQSSGQAINAYSGLMPGLCGSACVFVLAGGVKRVVPEGSIVAVHSARQVQTEFHDIVTGERQTLSHDKGEVARMFGSYYSRMGVNPALATLGEDTPHSDARVLTAVELKRYRLALGKL